MPRLINHKNVTVNHILYEDLAELFHNWGGIGEGEPNDTGYTPKVLIGYKNQLAALIAHQSTLDEQIRAEQLNKFLPSRERNELGERYLNALKKARDIWMEMENDDQHALTKCMSEIDSGHAIIDEIGLEPLLTSFRLTQDIAPWRSAALRQRKHERWGLDTEMLDLLVGAAQRWIEFEAPEKSAKIDPTLYAVMYIAEQCQTYGIDPSPTTTSRFTEIVDTYFRHTKVGGDTSERSSYTDIIRKANLSLKKSPNPCLTADPSWFETRLKLDDSN
ncbi:hypothetical protein SAMN05216206_2552 [Pseudomonas guineae]|uniref:Uncharacterized protein n=1 Tax=Pseudomonas guineae TaxID=425504 RepID=A0A1I3JNK3_9PSED|nr:hypothetical protein [Pseudomonas guineae]SFI61578.1 hypothetical protein SAMN05216206_2552 [Pseudomonas guineae]